MGWSFEHRDKGTSNLDFFRDTFAEGYELLDGATVGGTFYGALRQPDGTVTATVILTRWAPHDWFNFGTKSMTESCGPVEARCPERILDMLSPVEDLFPEGGSSREYATEWRKACRDYHARMRQVKRGSVIRLSALSADTYKAEDLRRNLFRDASGRLVRIPWWRTANFEVVPAAEHTDHETARWT